MVAIAKPTGFPFFNPFSLHVSLDGSGLPNGDVLSKTGTMPEISTSLVEVQMLLNNKLEKFESEFSINVPILNTCNVSQTLNFHFLSLSRTT